MYSKEEVANTKKLFWTSLGKYLGRHRSADGTKAHWLNYKTGVKDVYFRFELEDNKIAVCFDFQHRDDGIRYLFWEQLTELKTLFENECGLNWNWKTDHINPYHVVCNRVSISHEPTNIFDKNTWQSTFKFCELHLIALDCFWTEFKEIFKQLEN